MSSRLSLKLILGIALFGVFFSGHLAYRELFGSVPSAQSCPAPGAAGTVLGYPACVYGFFMYLAISGLAAAGLRRRNEHVSTASKRAELGAKNVASH